MIIIIDGKSGTGKSTIAKKLSDILDYLLVETGTIYRLLAEYLDRNGIEYGNAEKIKGLLKYSVINNRLTLDLIKTEEDINDEIHGRMAAKLATYNEIKNMINDSILKEVKGRNAVIEGRNTAITLFPKAEIKILLEADIETRAIRRKKQLGNNNDSLESIKKSLGLRDNIVEVKAENYTISIDTSRFDIDDTVSQIIRLVKQKEHKLTIVELKHFLYSAYQKDTAYKTCVGDWNRDNPTLGQCAITAMIINEYFGGEIFFGYYKEADTWHYWNVIRNEIVDFTIEQFKEETLEFDNIQKTTFEELYSHESVRCRYKLLKERMICIQDRYWKLNDDILKCRKCKNAHSPAYYTISLGTNCKILVIGEAPARNGWRITGNAWISDSGVLVPSGRILKKLLGEIGIELSDISYMEAIKCYPDKGKVTKEQRDNCRRFCIEQISLLRPQIVLSMGKYATEYLLGEEGKFSEKVGQYLSIDTEFGKIDIIPIYHTSPASPLSYKGNVEIFAKINQIINA